MVLITRNTNLDETMPQTVPSAGFTPPCDYTNFAENFDLSLLPGGEESTYNQFYQTPTTQSLLLTTTSIETTPNKQQNPKIFTSFYHQNNNSTTPTELSLDFEAELSPKKYENIFFQPSNNNNNLLDISVNGGGLLSPSGGDQFGQYRPSNEAYFYPSSPELSLYTPSPNSSIYSQSPRDDLYTNQLDIKQENFLSSPGPASPATSCSSGRCSSFDQIAIKEETITDCSNLINPNLRNLLTTTTTPPTQERRTCAPSPKDHQLLREALRDTSFQKKYNIKPIDFEFVSDFKMKEPDDNVQNDLMRENIEPVFNMAIEQMKKDIVSTCTALGISPDPHQWSCGNVLAWLQWTSRQFDLNDPIPEQWDMNGTTLLTLSEDDFVKRAPQGGMMLYAQLEIWKAAHSEDDLNPQWLTETASSNASSGDISDDDDDESNSSQAEPPNRPSTSSSRCSGPANNNNNNTSSTHIHLWQFLKELLQQPQTYGSCIRWLDRTKGIFKIEDSVKVARLWGKRKNRPAMNYDKLSRSIRQYYKKGIMKKTERSQRLVYQFCHPYNL